MSRIQLQLDEDCQAHALATALRQHGIDVVTTNEVSLAGASDEAQLEAAQTAGRVLVTNNMSDFVPLHARCIAQNRIHAGIIVFPQQEFSVGDASRALSRLIAD